MRSKTPALPVLVLILSLSGLSCRTTAPMQALNGSPGGASIHTPSDYVFPAHDTLSIATWNVEHFVDVHDNPYVENDRENAPDTAVIRRRLLWLAEGLRAIDADIIVLQEFESTVFASVLADTLVPDLGYRFVTGTDKGSWYQNVVVLSRLPLGRVYAFTSAYTMIEGEVDDGGRPARQMLTNHRVFAIEALVRPGLPVTVAGAHLKAGRGDRNAGWRMGQIQALHSHFSEVYAYDPARPFFVAGDLNLLPGSPEHTLLVNADRRLGPVTFVDALPTDARGFTHPSDEPGRRLDYVLHDTNTHARLLGIEILRPLGPRILPEMSDHLPVRARYLTR